VSYDQGIANRLRDMGVRVVECAGWQTHGSSDFNPRGSVNHHTAGGASGSCPSLNTCINGRPDLPGPLCNVMQSREPDGRDIAYVIAAGRANHAGSGGWKGLSGNSSVYGLEIEHTGTEPLPQHRQEIAARIHAAMFGGDASMVAQHREWAPDRKIDAAENCDGDAFRAMVANPSQSGEADLTQDEHNLLVAIYNTLLKNRDSGNPLGPRIDHLYTQVVGSRDNPNALGPRLDATYENSRTLVNELTETRAVEDERPE